MSFALKDLRIRAVTDWKTNNTTYVGSIELVGESAALTLKIDETMTRAIIDLCADNIVKVANETSALMKSELIEQQKQIGSHHD